MPKPVTSKIINTVAKPKAQVIFAHGAGANMQHDFMEKITMLLNEANISVLRFNFPYMDKRAETGKRYPPDRMPKLLERYQHIIQHLFDDLPEEGIPVFIGGKSMGGRVAATLVGEECFASNDHLASISHIYGVFCLGYPFHPPKKLDKLRLEPLQLTKKPILIVQGERDTLGSKAEIEQYQVSPLCRYVFLEDGDHSLKPRVKSGFNYQQHMKKAVQAVVDFIDEKISHDCA
ncbi:MAG: hypothetical protein OCD00_18755 [Colwellia sp.]